MKKYSEWGTKEHVLLVPVIAGLSLAVMALLIRHRPSMAVFPAVIVVGFGAALIARLAERAGVRRAAVAVMFVFALLTPIAAFHSHWFF